MVQRVATVASAKTLIQGGTLSPAIKLAVPAITDGHATAQKYVGKVNAALGALTIAMQNEAVNDANWIGAGLTFVPF